MFYDTGHPLLPLCSDYLKNLSILADLSQVPSHDNLNVTLLWQFILVPIYVLLYFTCGYLVNKSTR